VYDTGFDSALVQGSSHGLIDNVIDRPRPVIEGRDWWHNDCAGICRLLHRADMTGMQWGLAEEKNQRASLLQCDIGGTGDEVISAT
jgi:hypothetical protein